MDFGQGLVTCVLFNMFVASNVGIFRGFETIVCYGYIFVWGAWLLGCFKGFLSFGTCPYSGRIIKFVVAMGRKLIQFVWGNYFNRSHGVVTIGNVVASS